VGQKTEGKSLVLGNPPMEQGKNRDYLEIFTGIACHTPGTGQPWTTSYTSFSNQKEDSGQDEPKNH